MKIDRGQATIDLPGETRRQFSKPLEKMTDDELRSLVCEVGAVVQDLGEKVKVAKKADPYWFYQPSTGKLPPQGEELLREFLKPEDIPDQLDGQVHVHASRADIVGVAGGNQSSKTTTGTINDLIKSTGVLPPSLVGIADHRIPNKRPNACRVVCEDYRHGVLNHNLPTLQYWVPREFLIEGRWDHSWSEMKQSLTLVDPKKRELTGTIEYMTNEQRKETFQGPPKDRIRYDEEPREAIYDENMQRFVTGERIDVEFDMTPTHGMSWLYDRLFVEERTDAGQKIEWFKLCTATNPCANLMVVREICKRIKDYKTLKMRLLGEWISLSGLIYGKYFSRRIHVIPPEKFGLAAGQYLRCSCKHVMNGGGSTIPNATWHEPNCPFLEWLMVLGLDPHETKPTAGLLLGQNRNGTRVVDTCYMGDKTIPEVRSELNDMLWWYRYDQARCDPHCDTNRTAYPTNNHNIWEMLSRGKDAIPRIYKADAFPGSVLAGVDLVKQLLLVNDKSESPDLVILDRPENQMLIASMRTLQRDTWENEEHKGPKDSIQEGKHDHHACLRYAVSAKTRWRPFEQSVPQLPPELEAIY